jgi:nitric oxide reductase NorE protein
MENTIESTKKSIYYPPGGILIWFLIILEIITFLIASLVFLSYKNNDLEGFKIGQEFLSKTIGTLNTIILITSGYFIANAVQYLRLNDFKKASLATKISLILGVLFLLIKGMEYYQKINMGIGFEYNTFFTFYWLMTGFHFVHVLFGVGLLGYLVLALKKQKYNAKSMFDVESIATYWHMCDLIWILIFPILYLL